MVGTTKGVSSFGILLRAVFAHRLFRFTLQTVCSQILFRTPPHPRLPQASGSSADCATNTIILARPGLKNNTGLPKTSRGARLKIDRDFENFSKKTNRRRC